MIERCAQCGERLDPAGPGDRFPGACPRCVLAEALGSVSGADLARIGTRIGRYEILRILGSGGMGTVYVARQEGLDREVALKVLSPMARGKDVERFLLEARSLARLRHPNVVAVHEVASDGDVHFLAMDFVRGKTLADALALGPLEPRRAAEIVLAVARAVAHAHENGIVHRDLKPTNVLLDEREEPVVADFGLAFDLRRDPQLTGSGIVLGTGPYMAPEQASSRRGEIGPATDVYGLGALLYECATGEPPFWDSDPWELLRKVQEEIPVPPWELRKSVDRGLGGIALRAMEKEPARRYPSVAAMAEDLALYLGEGSRAVESRLAQGTGRFRRRRRLALWRALLVLAPVAGLSMVLWTWSSVRKEDRRLDEIGGRVGRERVAVAIAGLAGGTATREELERDLAREALRERQIYYLAIAREGEVVLSTAPLPEGLLGAIRVGEYQEMGPPESGVELQPSDVDFAIERGELKDALRVYAVRVANCDGYRGWVVLSRGLMRSLEVRALQQAGLFVALLVVVAIPLVQKRRKR
ncbi:MAG: serine/threonine protein kinase [Planctomycetes bacterium]|nr:serine/threonine protein kinase [Planctomycetota bacterium]